MSTFQAGTLFNRTTLVEPAIDRSIDPQALYRNAPELFFDEQFVGVTDDVAGDVSPKWCYGDLVIPTTTREIVACLSESILQETLTVHQQIAKKIFDLRQGDEGLFPTDGGYSLFIIRAGNSMVATLRLYFLPEHGEWYGYRSISEQDSTEEPWPVGTRVFFAA